MMTSIQRRACPLGVVAAFLFLAVSCTNADQPPPARVSDTLPKIVASVNGTNIERDTVLARLEQAKAMLAHQQHQVQVTAADGSDQSAASATAASAPVTEAQQAQHDAAQEKALLHSIINQMVVEELKKQEAARLGLSIPPDLLEANAKRIEEESGSQEALEEQLRQGHTNLEQWRTQLHQSLLFQELEARRRASMPVSDEEIRQYWEQNRATLSQLWSTDRLDQVRDRIRSLLQQTRWPTEEARWYEDLVRSAKIWVDPAVRQQLAKPSDHAHPGQPAAPAQRG